ncbi:UNVERIFIED_CONTAM: hypothetical protein RMT77_019880 [Armadillidium vulgare]
MYVEIKRNKNKNVDIDEFIEYHRFMARQSHLKMVEFKSEAITSVRSDNNAQKAYFRKLYIKMSNLNKQNNLQALLAISEKSFISQDTLDLHGVTKYEATKIIECFLLEALNRKLHLVNIISGEGKHSKNGLPVLKPLVDQFLSDNSFRFFRGKGLFHVFLDNKF